MPGVTHVIRRSLSVLVCAILPVLLVAGANRFQFLNSTSITLALVMVVFAAALAGGWQEALVAAAASGFALDYFVYLPKGLGIERGDQIVAFLVFMITAVGAGQISARERRIRREAICRQTDLEKLGRISDAICGCGNSAKPAQQIANELAAILGSRLVEIYDKSAEELHWAGDRQDFISADKMRDAAEGKCTQGAKNFAMLPLRAGIDVIGVMAIASADASTALLPAAADKVAAALAGAHAAKRANELEIDRRAQEFRAALMDATVHELRNAVNSIKIAVTYLLSEGAVGAAIHHEMLTTVDQCTGYLTRFIEESLQVSRATSAQLTAHKSSQDMKAIIFAALEKLRPFLRCRQLRIETADDLPAVCCDAGMIEKVVELIVENAVKYSPGQSPIGISAACMDELVVVSVSDRGPGVEEDERVRIFEENYRGRRERTRTSGSGLGLASARRLIEAHGGEIWVNNAPEGGAVFHFSLLAGGVCEQFENSHCGR